MPEVSVWRYDTSDDHERVTLRGFPCGAGGSNTIWSVVPWSERTGHRLIALPIPLFAPTEDGDGHTVTGFVADTRIWAASF